MDDLYPKGSSATSRLYCGIDGKWFFVQCGSEEDWKNLCTSTRLEYLMSDKRFETPAARRRNDAELTQILSGCFALAYADNWITLLRSNNVPVAPALYETEIYNEAQFLENDTFVWQDHPEIGRSQLVGFPAQFQNIENVLERCSPKLGEHTREILIEIGYDENQIADLKNTKVVFY